MQGLIKVQYNVETLQNSLQPAVFYIMLYYTILYHVIDESSLFIQEIKPIVPRVVCSVTFLQ